MFITLKIQCVVALACFWGGSQTALAQIYNDQTGDVIPGTEGTGGFAGVDLSNWDTPSHNLQYARLTNNLIDGNAIHNPHLDLTGANFSNSWLNNAEFYETILDSVNFSTADLTGADFSLASLNKTNFTNAIISQAAIGYMSQSQFYSTANYQTKNVQGVHFNVVSGWDFTGCDLTGCSFYAGSGNLSIGANLTDAIVANANFSGFTSGLPAALSVTASYQSKDLHGVNFSNANLTSWDLSGQNLTGDNFLSTTVTGVNFANAVIAGTNLGALGLTLSQVISTASYENFDLHGVYFGGVNLTGIDLRNQNLSTGGFAGTNLTGANMSGANLTNAGFNLTNLTNANLSNANLTGATINSIVTGATFTGAIFAQVRFTGWNLSAPQFYTTANYASKDFHGDWINSGTMAGYDLSGFNLSDTFFQEVDFTGASFTGANLTNTSFDLCVITGADLTNAVLNHTTFICSMTADQLYSTASYKNHSLVEVWLIGYGDQTSGGGGRDMSGWDLSNQDLTGSIIGANNLTGTNFTGAIIAEVNFFGEGVLSQEQFYSTASYQNKDLHEITIGQTMVGWNFNGQNLQGARLGGDLTSATFVGADLIGATIQATITSNDFTCADLRGSGIGSGSLNNCIFRNTIRYNGTIQGLNLLPGDQLIIHNYSLPISVLASMTLTSGSTLQMDFDASPWTSTITTPAGVVPQLAGTLDLTFSDGVDPTTLVGSTYHLFEWTVSPALGDQFDQISSDLPAGLFWDLSGLYTTGQISLFPEPSSVFMALAPVVLLFRRRGQSHRK